MIDFEIDPYTWYANRQLPFKPKHFILTKTPITTESKQWIYAKLRGRFAMVGSVDLTELSICPAFEDPEEAVFYELVWS